MTASKVFAGAAALVFFVNILFSLFAYNKLTQYPYAKVEAKLISQKPKASQNGNIYFLLNFKSNDFSFQTTSQKSFMGMEDGYFSVTVKTANMGFLDFLKAPRLKNTDIISLQQNDRLKQHIKDFIASQHSNNDVKEIYLNLFLNSEVSGEVDSFIKNYGLGAFFALSGLNVALIVGFMFVILSPIFSYFQDRFFPYLNRKVWIVSASLVFLLFYAYLTDFTPSFIRAVVSAFVLFYLGIRGANLFGGKTLLAAVIVCIAVFPTFLFSIGFWLSVCGVFLIYVFIANTNFKSELASYFALSIWLFFAMQPILHYLFGLFTGAHLLNPIFSVLFDVFYPLSILCHILHVGWIFDDMLLAFVGSADSFAKYDFTTPAWFFVLYCALALLSIFKKDAFLAFNTAAVSYAAGAGFYLLSGM